MRILVVEDDNLLITLCYNLTSGGYLVDAAVIFLTARDMESDQIRGFELGADDYVTKPFPLSVFQRKVAALLARISKQNGGDYYDDGNLFINFSEMSAALKKQPVSFTPMEYRLLKVLTKIPTSF